MEKDWGLPKDAGAFADEIDRFFKAGKKVPVSSIEMKSESGLLKNKDQGPKRTLSDLLKIDFLEGYVQAEIHMRLDLRGMAQLIHASFPIWKDTTLNDLKRIGGTENMEAVSNIENLELSNLLNFAHSELEQVIKQLVVAPSESEEYRQLDGEAQKWSKIAEFTKAASEYKQ